MDSDSLHSEAEPPRSPGRLALYAQLLGQMGLRYVVFRAGWEAQRRTHLLKRRFPLNPPRRHAISLAEWRLSAPAFFFESKETLTIPRHPSDKLAAEADRWLAGNVRLFSSRWLNLGLDWDWHTHPETEYEYPRRHWTEISDFSTRAGDIKQVWEKARFSFLYTLIRHDYHNGVDMAEAVLGQIEHFIMHNPINQGPHYRCSQEMSLRVLNWTMALYYYRHSERLTEARFEAIMHVIRWHLHHIRQAIHFSRIAVRNNHAITETLMLTLSGLLFPFFAETAEYARKGRRWLEQEVEYQIYEDGTYLQFSMNYHRVVVQLLSWGLRLTQLHGKPLSETVQERARKSLTFLLHCQDEASGWLPNYGANDGALFFPLSSSPYRSYRPQLYALAAVLGQPPPYAGTGSWQEEASWLFGGSRFEVRGSHMTTENIEHRTSNLEIYPASGYAVLKETDTLTFMRCGRHADRPSQADNLHLDLWHRGRNLLRDAGSYKYNTDRDTLMDFVGTPAHNTVSLGPESQMQKGPRFIWLHWSQAEALETLEEDDYIGIRGRIRAFGHLAAGGITHTRTVRKHRQRPLWLITDELSGTLHRPLLQHWHPAEGYEKLLRLEARDAQGQPLEARVEEGWYSGFYGKRIAAPHLIFATRGRVITTEIELLNPNLPVPAYADMPLDEA